MVSFSKQPLSTDAPDDSPTRGGPVARQDALYHVFWALTDGVRALHADLAQ